MEGQKVITASEMARIEKASIDAGASDAAYMNEAGKAIAEITHEFISQHHLERKVTLLVGKGNNGGDAFVAGCYLLEHHYQVLAIALFKQQEVSPLSNKHWKMFEKLGGKFVSELPSDGVLLDGLLGTGAAGPAKEPIASLIEKANASNLPLLAIDIPSGLGGNDGHAEGVVIQATYTLYLGVPKAGFFLGLGMDFTGGLIGCDFGLDPSWIEKAKGVAFLLDDAKMPTLLPHVAPTRHKYEAGYILALAGSPGMMGAAHMACMAAYRTGAGIIRLFQEEESGPEEIVHSAWDPHHFDEEQNRAKALLLGPGIGRSNEAKEKMTYILDHMKIPAIIDADGLFFLAQLKNHVFKTPVILTPHRKEMERLLDEELNDPISQCQKYAEEKSATIVLKGAPTFIFHPGKPALIMLRGGPGLAKAGTGDVLTGIIAAYLAQGLETREAAALGSWLHGLVGERICLDKTEYGLIATDLIEMIPEVLREIV